MRGWNRTLWIAAPRLVACLLCILIGWSGLATGFSITPTGVQCPTASVQFVSTASRDCCGRLVCSKRAPRPGDRGFVQCRCAEKRASDQVAAAPNGGRVIWITTAAAELRLPNRLPEPPARSEAVLDLNSRVTAPEIPPPSA